MEEVFRIFFDLRNIKLNHDDGASDRTSRLYSSALIIILATIVSARQCLGEAIHCWCPELCAPNHEKYANLMCWVDDTYFVPFLEGVPQQGEPRARKVTYYQWVPIILMLQALLFLTPWVVWKALTSRFGVHLGSIVEAASKSQLSLKREDREAALGFAVYLMDRYLVRKGASASPSCPSRRRCRCRCCTLGAPRCSLFASYLAVKVLYLANAVGQVFLLDEFLGVEFYTFGYHVIAHLASDRKWTPTDRFPHVTLCDFRVRQSTNVNQYTVQCVLPINIFNEKVFAVIWFWLVLVASVTLVSLLRWLWSVLVARSALLYVRENLELLRCPLLEDKVEYRTLEMFSESYLGRDGVFVLELVAGNAGRLVVSEILWGLWSGYGRSCCNGGTRGVTGGREGEGGTSCIEAFRRSKKSKQVRVFVPDISDHYPLRDV